jgi:hypothetical protein
MDAKPAKSPLDPQTDLADTRCEDKPANRKEYLSMVGSLILLQNCESNIEDFPLPRILTNRTSPLSDIPTRTGPESYDSEIGWRMVFGLGCTNASQDLVMSGRSIGKPSPRAWNGGQDLRWIVVQQKFQHGQLLELTGLVRIDLDQHTDRTSDSGRKKGVCVRERD